MLVLVALSLAVAALDPCGDPVVATAGGHVIGITGLCVLVVVAEEDPEEELASVIASVVVSGVVV